MPKDFLKSKDEIVFKREIQKLHPDVRILFKNIYPVFLSVKEEKKLNFNDYDFVSLLFLFIDDAAHKSECETFHKKLFHDHLIKMMNSSNVIQIIDQLISSNFKIYICSDHGTIYSKGNGIDADKFLTESHARRALRYSNKHLAQEKAKESNSLFWWDPETLGEDDFFVLAAGDSMFDKQTSFAITHGGISVQEVIVPFVEIIS